MEHRNNIPGASQPTWLGDDSWVDENDSTSYGPVPDRALYAYRPSVRSNQHDDSDASNESVMAGKESHNVFGYACHGKTLFMAGMGFRTGPGRRGCSKTIPSCAKADRLWADTSRLKRKKSSLARLFPFQ